MSKKMREKYCRGLCSETFIETGVPTIRREQIAAAKREIKQTKKKDAKERRKAERKAAKIYKENCRNADVTPAENIVFC